MKTYNVKEIAEMVNTNPETVRRWIRSGKLEAQQNSRKDGNTVREEDLYRFLRSTGKYTGVAAAMAIANPVLGIATLLGTAVGAGIVSHIVSSRGAIDIDNFDIVSEDLVKILKEKKQESVDIIKKKEAAIAQLKEEISREKQNIKDYDKALMQISNKSPIKEESNE